MEKLELMLYIIPIFIIVFFTYYFLPYYKRKGYLICRRFVSQNMKSLIKELEDIKDIEEKISSTEKMVVNICLENSFIKLYKDRMESYNNEILQQEALLVKNKEVFIEGIEREREDIRNKFNIESYKNTKLSEINEYIERQNKIIDGYKGQLEEEKKTLSILKTEMQSLKNYKNKEDKKNSSNNSFIDLIDRIKKKIIASVKNIDKNLIFVVLLIADYYIFFQMIKESSIVKIMLEEIPLWLIHIMSMFFVLSLLLFMHLLINKIFVENSIYIKLLKIFGITLITFLVIVGIFLIIWFRVTDSPGEHILDLALVSFLFPVIFAIAVSTKEDKKSMGFLFIFNPLRTLIFSIVLIIVYLMMFFEILIKKISYFLSENYSNEGMKEYKLFQNEITKIEYSIEEIEKNIEFKKREYENDVIGFDSKRKKELEDLKIRKKDLVNNLENKYNLLVSNLREKKEKEGRKIESLIEGCSMAVIRGFKID